MSGPVSKQPAFDWKVPVGNFEIDIRNIFLTNDYNIQDSDKVPIIMIWLGHKGLRLLQTLNGGEQQKCKTSSGLSEILNEKFKP